MAKLGDLIVRVGVNTESLNNDLKQVKGSMKKMTGELQNVGKQMSMAVTAPLVIMGATSVQAFREQNKAIAQVEAGLKSTANQVGFTSKELQKMATDLQNKTLFGDEVILKDATAQLLTFTNISGENFARTQQAALDLATRLDGDLKGASIQLGKALNDPVANLSALSRSGIQFSDEQKGLIKTLAETGRLAEAQTLILDELNKQYGGSAQAAAEADGGFTQLANSFGDLQEIIGGLLVQYLQPIVNQLKTFIQWLSETSTTTQTIALAFAAFAAAIGPLLFIIPNVIAGIKAVGVAIQFMNAKMLATPFGMYAAAAAGIIALGAAIYSVTKNYRDLNAAQNALNDNTQRAIALTAEQRTKTELLVTTAQDMNVEEGKRLAAIEELNKISPKYLGGLTLENINHSEGKAMLSAYNEELLRKAKIQAAQEKIVEIEKQLIDLAAQSQEGPGFFVSLLGRFSYAAHGAQMQQMDDQMKNLIDQQQALTQFVSENTTAADIQAQSVTNTADAYAHLSDNIDEVGKSSDKTKEKLNDKSNTLGYLFNQLEEVPDETVFKPLQTGIDDAKDSLGDLFSMLEQTPALEYDAEVAQQMKEDFDSLTQSASAVGNNLGGVFADLTNKGREIKAALAEGLITPMEAMEQKSEAGKNAIRGLVKDGILALIKFAKMNVIANATSSMNTANLVTGGLATPAFIVAGLSMLEGFIGGLTAFADGGIVSGPTMGLIGEYPGARNNPEVIAPLDKLRSMLGTQNVMVTGKISGRDILLTSERNAIDRNRVRGF